MNRLRRRAAAAGGRGANTQDRGTQHGGGSANGIDEPEVATELLSDSESEQVYANGLASRRRMHDEYKITSENDMNRRSGNNHQYISRGFLEMLAARMQDGGDGEGNSEDCLVM